MSDDTATDAPDELDPVEACCDLLADDKIDPKLLRAALLKLAAASSSKKGK